MLITFFALYSTFTKDMSCNMAPQIKNRLTQFTIFILNKFRGKELIAFPVLVPKSSFVFTAIF